MSTALLHNFNHFLDAQKARIKRALDRVEPRLHKRQSQIVVAGVPQDDASLRAEALRGIDTDFRMSRRGHATGPRKAGLSTLDGDHQ